MIKIMDISRAGEEGPQPVQPHDRLVRIEEDADRCEQRCGEARNGAVRAGLCLTSTEGESRTSLVPLRGVLRPM
ncbi:hypothetical protein GCM10022252_08250 [Streptosporangium oxazolinicum]|uniref:Uncharacterized protein n=1 Tax=Streptosporangium oxazolinicum TaxID=909287 RepID=A0ABP8AEF0_9ACTN